MSVFHRVRDPMKLGSSRYFLFAERLHCYGGALRSALTAERADDQPATVPVTPQAQPPSLTATPGEEVRYIDVEDVQQLVNLSNQGGFVGFDYVGG